MGIFSRLGDFAKKVSNIPGDISIGALKGIGSTALSIGNIGAGAIDKVLGSITGSTAFDGESRERGMQQIKDVLAPTGAAQKMGFAGEQIAEFFTPGGVVGGAVNGASKALGVVRSAPAAVSAVASKAPALSRIISGGASAVKEGLQAAGVSLQQRGDIKEAIATGVTSAALAPAAPLVSWLGKKVTSYAPRVINSLVKPISKEFEFGRNAGEGVLREGVKGATRESFYQNLLDKRNELGRMIGEKLSKVDDVTIDVTPAINAIDDSLKKANKRGETELATRLRSLKDAMMGEFDEATGQLIGPKNMTMTPEEARQLKTEIGEATRWTGQAFDNDINQARVSVYRAINNLIDDAVPGVKDLNARYADILSAERSMKRTMDIIERQNLVGLPSVVLGSEGRMGLLGAIARSTVASTPVKTAITAPLLGAAGAALSKASKVNLRPAVSGFLGKVAGSLMGGKEPTGQPTMSQEQSQVDSWIESHPNEYKTMLDRIGERPGMTEEKLKMLIQQKISQ